MLITPQADGTILIEGRADHFSDAWKQAQRKDRLILDDGRPAVRKLHDDGRIVITTVHPNAWDILKQLPRSRTAPSKTRLCEWCGSELKVTREMEQYWVFHCPSCQSAETWDKGIVGGTAGAGEKEKV